MLVKISTQVLEIQLFTFNAKVGGLLLQRVWMHYLMPNISLFRNTERPRWLRFLVRSAKMREHG